MVSSLSSAQYDDLLNLILAFSKQSTPDQLLDTLLTKMMDMSHADAGTLYLLQGDQLHFCIVKNKTLGINQSATETTSFPPIALDASNLDNVSAYTAVKKQVVIVDDVYSDMRFNFTGPKNYDSMTGYKTKSMLMLPMTFYKEGESKLLGVIQLINATNKENNEICSFSNVIDDFILVAISNITTSVLFNYLLAQSKLK